MTAYELPALSALLTVIVAVVTIRYKPTIQSPNPQHTNDAIIAFELARTDPQIKSIFVAHDQKPAVLFIQKVRFLTWFDFLFILCYTLFTVSFAWEAVKAQSWLCDYLALLLAPLIGLFDVLENSQLFQILNAVEKNVNATFQPALRRLSVFTWIKWQGTGLLMVLLIPFLWIQPDYWSKVLIAFVGGTFVLGIIAFQERIASTTAMAQAKRFTNAIFITFALFALYAIFNYFKN